MELWAKAVGNRVASLSPTMNGTIASNIRMSPPFIILVQNWYYLSFLRLRTGVYESLHLCGQFVIVNYSGIDIDCHGVAVRILGHHGSIRIIGTSRGTTLYCSRCRQTLESLLYCSEVSCKVLYPIECSGVICDEYCKASHTYYQCDNQKFHVRVCRFLRPVCNHSQFPLDSVILLQHPTKI